MPAPRPDDTPLALRRRPTQARAIATFTLILDTATELLDRHGVAAFNTNLLAEAAGLSVRAVYQYFPNKLAVIAELARRMSESWYEAMGSVGSLKNPALPWRKLWADYIHGFVAAVRATPGSRPVLFAMRDIPELRAIDEVANQRYIAGIAKALTIRRPDLPPIRARAAAAVLNRSMVAILDDSFAAPDHEAAVMVELLVDMQLMLLESLLEPEARPVKAPSRRR
jgi:AcrR family transcriptional regulator